MVSEIEVQGYAHKIDQWPMEKEFAPRGVFLEMSDLIISKYTQMYTDKRKCMHANYVIKN